MKFPRFLALASLATLLVAPLTAQTAAAPAATAAPKVLPTARVAWLNSSAFMEEGGGIKQLIKVLKELELEFSGTESELSLLNEKLRTLVGELQKLQAGGEANAAAIQEKQTQGMQMQRELQQKQQAAQQAIAAAQQEKQAPIAAQISKALAEFTKERNIDLLLDAAKLGDAVLIAKPELDVTADFIAYFNAKNP
jgi:Skp family chaperone for outer membrane proteins